MRWPEGCFMKSFSGHLETKANPSLTFARVVPFSRRYILCMLISCFNELERKNNECTFSFYFIFHSTSSFTCFFAFINSWKRMRMSPFFFYFRMQLDSEGCGIYLVILFYWCTYVYCISPFLFILLSNCFFYAF